MSGVQKCINFVVLSAPLNDENSRPLGLIDTNRGIQSALSNKLSKINFCLLFVNTALILLSFQIGWEKRICIFKSDIKDHCTCGSILELFALRVSISLLNLTVHRCKSQYAIGMIIVEPISEWYWKPCQTAGSASCEINQVLKAVNYFRKKLLVLIVSQFKIVFKNFWNTQGMM